MARLGVADRVRVERLGALRAQVVDRQVAGDRQQPGRDPAAAGVVGAGVAPGAGERLLRDLLGDRVVADHASPRARTRAPGSGARTRSPRRRRRRRGRRPVPHRKVTTSRLCSTGAGGRRDCRRRGAIPTRPLARIDGSKAIQSSLGGYPWCASSLALFAIAIPLVARRLRQRRQLERRPSTSTTASSTTERRRPRSSGGGARDASTSRETEFKIDPADPTVEGRRGDLRRHQRRHDHAQPRDRGQRGRGGHRHLAARRHRRPDRRPQARHATRSTARSTATSDQGMEGTRHRSVAGLACQGAR